MPSPPGLADLLADLARIRDVLHILEQALGQSDLVPQFEAELARWQRARPIEE